MTPGVFSQGRIHVMGKTLHAHEKAGVDFALSQLPNSDPYQVWGLFELARPAEGRIYEIDLVVLGPRGFYLIEIKSRPGKYTGDQWDWTVAPKEGGRPVTLENPYRLTNHKAKVLSSLLSRHFTAGRAPWVTPLVFLSAEGVDVQSLKDCIGVVTRSTLKNALTQHVFPGGDPSNIRTPVNVPIMREAANAMRAIGVRQRRGELYVGSCELVQLLWDGPNYQDWEAQHRTDERVRRRARVFLVPEKTSVEERQRLKRAAEREFKLMQDVRDYPGILSLIDYIEDGPLGPTILYDDFADGEPLDAFIRRHPELSFSDRVELMRQLGYALGHCHKRGVFHGNLGPRSVLVRRRDNALEIRLFNFSLGRSEHVTPTFHRTLMLGEAQDAYQAPELREDPSNVSSLTDCFSLGAIAYLVLTGKAGAESGVALELLLRDQGNLNPALADDTIPPRVAELVAFATEYCAANRADSAEEWVELLLDAATAPAAPIADNSVPPLKARPEDLIGGRFLVEAILGQGATARVLKVVDEQHDNRSFALKISLNEEHDVRLSDEGRALGKLRDRRIVQFIEEVKIDGRVCLLLSLAGDTTLYHELTRQGPISIDLAARYGEDLLDALMALEEAAIPHRDIKPANLGVGASSQKRAHHLVLFDFSLVAASHADVELGTAAYRDPFLIERKLWDAAADRWSAAVTLHEMLTGERPKFSGPPLATDSLLILAAERFEAAREALVGFFIKSLARRAEERFLSAEDMKRAWSSCFVERARVAPSLNAVEEPEIDFRAIPADTPIALLPLSIRARNGLERAGLTHARDLLGLPANRLSAVRGVGTSVAKDILKFRDEWQQANAIPVVISASFLPTYAGPALATQASDLPPGAQSVFLEAGLATLAAIANSSAVQVTALCAKAQLKPEVVRGVLARASAAARQDNIPATLEAWCERLLGGQGKQIGYIRELFGLGEPFLGRLDVQQSEVAKQHKITPANIYIALRRCREQWRQASNLEALSERCRQLVEENAGALPLAKAAELLFQVLPNSGSEVSAQKIAEAAALLRVCAEAEDEEQPRLWVSALPYKGSRGLWAFSTANLEASLCELAKAADALAAREVLASPAEVERVLRACVANTRLESLPSERLIALAAEASTRAAVSSRLELYPRGLAAARALELSAAILSTGANEGLSREDLVRRVRGRYSEAEPLPEGAALETLMQKLGFQWMPEMAHFVREDASPSATFLTTGKSNARSHNRSLTALSREQVAASDFESRVRITLERRDIRLLSVNAHDARLVASRLAAQFGLRIVDVDHLLVAEMQRLAKRDEIELGAVHAADREGATGEHWSLLVGLARDAARELTRELLPAKEPLLLCGLGLVSRYGLTQFLTTLVESVKSETSAAVFLLIAGNGSSGFAIGGRVAVPGVLSSQQTRLSSEWVLEGRE